MVETIQATANTGAIGDGTHRLVAQTAVVVVEQPHLGLDGDGQPEFAYGAYEGFYVRDMDALL